MSDRGYLERAIELAGQSEEEVGCACVIVRDGEILAEEINSQNYDQIAVNHAEIKAIISANKFTGSRKLTGAEAFCSCEPCAMCVAALSYAKVGRIVFASTMADMFPDDPQSELDINEFAKHLNFVPKIEQLIV
jgi:tRNA(Arg) A34 adenosine deaminase TadA